MWAAFSLTACVIFVYMFLFFVLAQKMGNNAIVDVAWGGGFVVIVIFNLMMTQQVTTRQIIVTALVTLWGIRLFIHLYNRNWGKPEEYRYRQMREKWGNKATWRAFWVVFMFQGFLMLIVGYPLILVQVFPWREISVIDGVGIGVWTVGLLFEVIADNQLKRFVTNEKKDRSHVMTRGLWRYSRHPNYFGEVLLWWGIYLIVIQVPLGWTGVVSPLMITFLLLRVSGIPLLEKRYLNNAAYQAYAEKTSVFVPWFPKH